MAKTTKVPATPCPRLKNKRYVTCIKRHLPVLRYLSKLNDQDLARVAAKLKPSLLRILTDIALNLSNPQGALHSKFSKCPRQEAVVYLSQKPSAKSNAQKRHLIAQEGSGFIAPLIGLALPTLVELVSGLLKK